MKNNVKTKIREPFSDRLFYGFVIFLMILVLIITLYPFIYVLSMSLSDPVSVMKQEIWLYPKGFSLQSYKRVLSEPGIWRAYGNTIFYTVFGTLINVVMTVMLAYPLSRKHFWGRKAVTMFVTVTMFFSGGMIPAFLLVKNLGMYNTRWALIIPGAIGVYNMIIARTYFSGISESMYESASIDGANDITILTRIILPVSKAILAVLTLFYAIAHWNTYFNALLYTPNLKLQPLQMYLVKLLIQNESSMLDGMTDTLERSMYAMQIKYATIIVVIVPILCVYPFLQKHFAQGVMIGAVKE